LCRLFPANSDSIWRFGIAAIEGSSYSPINVDSAQYAASESMYPELQLRSIKALYLPNVIINKSATMYKKILLVMAGIACAALSAALFAQGENPFIGTWDIDMERSNFGSATPPASMSRTYYDHGDGSYSYIVVTINQEGVVNASSARYDYSGDTHPIANFNQDVQATISYKKIHDTSVEYTVYVDGEISQIGAKFVSPNFQQLSIAIQSPNSDLQDQILIFNKRNN
jgi:hypothetical protein